MPDKKLQTPALSVNAAVRSASVCVIVRELPYIRQPDYPDVDDEFLFGWLG